MNTRYYIEHIALYKQFAHDPIKVISKLLTEKEAYIYNFFLSVYDEKKEACPFLEKDFEVSTSEKDQLEYIIIKMPSYFIEPTLCHKIIIAYSMNLDLYEYFTIEDGLDPIFGKYLVLGSWNEGYHYTFGTINPGDSIEDKIYDIALV